MKENFDKKLSNRIKEVVEDQNLPYNPEHWDMLLAKKNEKKKKRYILLWRSAAALLLLIAVGSLGKFYFSQPNSEKIVAPEINIVNSNDSLKKENLNGSENTLIADENVDSLNTNKLQIKQTDSKFIKIIPPKTVEKTLITSNERSIPKKVENKNSIKNKIGNNNNDLVKKDDVIIQSKEDVKEKDDVFTEQVIVAENKPKKDSLKDINELIASKIDPKKSTSKSIKIGVNISSGINYNQKIINSNLGFAGGVSIDLPLSEKLDLYSGILYTDQKLNVNGQDLVYASGPGILSGNDTQEKSEKAILKGIEIPVNLKYNFSINNKKVFVSSGFSSTYYFEENIETDYTVNSRVETITQDSFGNNIVKYNLVESNEKMVISGDNNFNFANILNLSMGIELPLNRKQQTIVLEPYFKYSIRPVTSENIDFSSAGIFLRYNFNFSQK
ncbi:MAG: outer membrane beta-barrel protein [Bacteroidota bacterium]